ELVDDDRQQLDQDGASLFAAQRPVGARPPKLHGGGDFARLPKFKFRQAVERLAAGSAGGKIERQVLLLREQTRRAFEQCDIVFLDRAQMRKQSAGKRIAVLEAEKAPEGFERRGL